MRIIVAGSRTFFNRNRLFEVMDKLTANLDSVTIVSGCAQGADQLGEQWSRARDHKLKLFPADWNRHGKRAGFIRNEEMARNADALVAFWDGQSRGTQHMIETAKQAGLKVRVIKI